ncbi:MAG: DUF2220 family protein [Clostridia bacterium]
MSEFTTVFEIKEIVNKKWENGSILKSAVCELCNIFPLKIKLKSPTPKNLSENLDMVRKWSNELIKNSKEQVGYGYDIVFKETTNQIVGKNKVATHVEFENIDECVKFLKKEKSLFEFIKIKRKLLDFEPKLKEYIVKNPLKILNKTQEFDEIIAVLDWFLKNSPENLYLRQLDIENVDTKFIENNRSIISELLDIILPQTSVDFDAKTFEGRYHLKSKPILVRFRILDDNLKIQGISDITIPVEQFERLEMPFENVFFVENEINFLSFPDIPKSCVIFSAGYGVVKLKNAKWLNDKNLYYWGDIDTHGFNILSIAREYFPQISSFLMAEQVLIEHQTLWAFEEKQYVNTITRLKGDEFLLACRLQDNFFRQGVRLEQERIKFSYIINFLKETFDFGIV